MYADISKLEYNMITIFSFCKEECTRESNESFEEF